MQTDMDRFCETFFEEAAEHVLNMESVLLAMEDSPGDQELLNTIFRSAHTIKGASSIFGFEEVSNFTHSLENLLDKMRAGVIDSSPERLDLLLRSLDVIRGLLASAMDKAGPTPGMEQVLCELKGALGQVAEPVAKPATNAGCQASSAPRAYRVGFVPGRDIFRQGMDPLLFLRDLSQIGERLETRVDLSQLPPLSEFDPESCYLGWSVRLTTAKTPEQIAELFEFVEDSSQVSIEVQLGNRAGKADEGKTVETNVLALAGSPTVPLRVPLSKAADLIHLAIDLVHDQARLLHAAGDWAVGLHG